jgi:glycosyltransferase involved in cell wall biosynthesis
MKILLATPSILREVGGPAYSISSIRNYLQQISVDTVICTRNSKGGISLPLFWDDGLLEGVDLIHNFGTWTPFNHLISLKARQAGIPQVFCPMGMLEPWSLQQKRLKKRLGWLSYQRNDIEKSAVVHATSRFEAENLRALGIKTPIAVIAHGIDLPEYQLDVSTLHPDHGEKTLLFLSRLHPKKGLLELIEACARLKQKNWKVIIAGPDQDGYQAVIESAIAKAKLQDKFSLVGPVYDKQKPALFGQADIFVLPTHSENFGLVIPEALSYGIPVITTTGAPWSELNEFDCGWWTATGADALECALSEAISMASSTLAEKGARGRALVADRYSWSAIIQRHLVLYEWLIGFGQEPEFIFD